MSTNSARVLRTAAAAMGSTPARIKVIEPTELGQAIHELVGQQIDLDEFARRFLISRVYTLSPVLPGLFVMSRPGRLPIVPLSKESRYSLRVAVAGAQPFSPSRRRFAQYSSAIALKVSAASMRERILSRFFHVRGLCHWRARLGPLPAAFAPHLG